MKADVTLTEREPEMAFSLGEMLGDEMVARGWTIEDVGARMGIHGAARDSLILATVISVQSDSLVLTDDFFSGLAKAFDVSEDFFRNIHRQWLAHPFSRQTYDAPDELFGPWLREALSPAGRRALADLDGGQADGGN